MTRFVIFIILIVAGYLVLRHIMRMPTQGTYRRGETGGSRNREHVNTEQEYREILGVADEDSPATIRMKYRELLAKYHPDKVQHLGIEFQEMAERKTRAIMEAYEFFRKKDDF